MEKKIVLVAFLALYISMITTYAIVVTMQYLALASQYADLVEDYLVAVQTVQQLSLELLNRDIADLFAQFSI